MKTYLYRAANFKSTITFFGPSFIAEVNFWSLLKSVVTYDLFIIIRECGSTLYVGLASAIPPTNTNFRLSFLLTRLW